MKEALRAAGYLVMAVPAALLIASSLLGTPWLTFCVLMGGLPLLRPVFGEAGEEAPEWSEQVASFLHVLPTVVALLLLAAIGFVVRCLPFASYSEWVGWGLSLWIALTFGSCIAHELLHRSGRSDKLVGRLLSGAIGYPFQEHEHRAHHRPSRATEGEWPSLNESMWRFTFGRLKHVGAVAWEGDTIAAHQAGHRLAGGLSLAGCSMAATALAFSLAGGAGGLLLYVAVSLGVAWAIQAVTYIQHWGLEPASRRSRDFEPAWEDRCRLQSWLTLGISFHQSHHERTAVPYYRQVPSRDAPRLPSGYLLLLVASMVPPIWRKWMGPTLTRWHDAPRSQSGAGRKLFCLPK